MSRARIKRLPSRPTRNWPASATTSTSSPAMPTAGAAMPMRLRWLFPARIVASTRSVVARRIASFSETWVETWMTFSRSEASSM